MHIQAKSSTRAIQGAGLDVSFCCSMDENAPPNQKLEQNNPQGSQLEICSPTQSQFASNLSFFVHGSPSEQILPGQQPALLLYVPQYVHPLQTMVKLYAALGFSGVILGVVSPVDHSIEALPKQPGGSPPGGPSTDSIIGVSINSPSSLYDSLIGTPMHSSMHSQL